MAQGPGFYETFQPESIVPLALKKFDIDLARRKLDMEQSLLDMKKQAAMEEITKRNAFNEAMAAAQAPQRRPVGPEDITLGGENPWAAIQEGAPIPESGPVAGLPSLAPTYVKPELKAMDVLNMGAQSGVISPTDYAKQLVELQKVKPPKEASQWSAPYELGGATVQKNLETQEIRTAVSRPPAEKIPEDKPLTDLGKLQADKDKYLKDGHLPGSPLILAIDAEINKHSAPEKMGALNEANLTARALKGDKEAEQVLKAMDTRRYERENALMGLREKYNQNKIDLKEDKADRVFAANLRKEFNQLPEMKEYGQTVPKILSMQSAYDESKTTKNFVAVDQALITLYNKLTDPSSVVRESEYARTAQNIPLINRVKGKFQKVMEGGAGLTPEERGALMDMALLMMKGYVEIRRRRMAEYRSYGVQAGLPESFLSEPMEGVARKDKDVKVEPSATGGGQSVILTEVDARRTLSQKGIVGDRADEFIKAYKATGHVK